MDIKYKRRKIASNLATAMAIARDYNNRVPVEDIMATYDFKSRNTLYNALKTAGAQIPEEETTNESGKRSGRLSGWGCG
jgi:hypothetical protein